MAGSHRDFFPSLSKPGGRRTFYFLLAALLLWPGAAAVARAQEKPYFTTYDHHLEEPGNLEVELTSTTARPNGGNRFFSGLAEFEYGMTEWWTTEVYLEGQSTAHDSTVFSGFRVENRFRVLPGKHRINPALYAEYENTSAGKTLNEVVGFDSQADALEPNGIARRDIEREMETRLILSSDFKRWNVSENFVAAKNFAGNPWEFGYAFGLCHPLGLAALPFQGNFRNFRAGLEVYGGLGTADRLTLRDTSHYLAPVLAWSFPHGPRFKISPAFGLANPAYKFILRLGVSYEFSGFGRHLRRFLAGEES